MRDVGGVGHQKAGRALVSQKSRQHVGLEGEPKLQRRRLQSQPEGGPQERQAAGAQARAVRATPAGSAPEAPQPRRGLPVVGGGAHGSRGMGKGGRAGAMESRPACENQNGPPVQDRRAAAAGDARQISVSRARRQPCSLPKNTCSRAALQVRAPEGSLVGTPVSQGPGTSKNKALRSGSVPCHLKRSAPRRWWRHPAEMMPAYKGDERLSTCIVHANEHEYERKPFVLLRSLLQLPPIVRL